MSTLFFLNQQCLQRRLLPNIPQDRPPSRSQSPPPTHDGTPRSCSPVSVSPPRLRKTRPSPVRNPPVSSRRRPSAAPKAFPGGNEEDRTATPTAAAGSMGLLSGSPRRGDGGGSSTLRRPLVLKPTSPQEARAADWLPAAVSGGAGGTGALKTATKNSSRSGGDAADAGGGGRDAKLNSLLVLSPGKDYWAGRLAEKGSRDSESPPAAARNGERRKNKNRAAFGVGGDKAAASSPIRKEVSDLISPARRGRNKALRPVESQEQQQRQQRRQDDGGSSVSLPASASARKKKGFLSVAGGKPATPLSPGRNTSRSGENSGGGERPNPVPSRALQSDEGWTPPSRQVASPSTVVSWSPVKGQRRPDFRPSSRPVVREDNTTVIAALSSAAETQGGGGLASLEYNPAGGDSSFGRASSPAKSPLGVGFTGESRSASPKEKKSPLGADLGVGGRNASPLQRQV